MSGSGGAVSLCIHLNQDLAYIFRQEVYGEAVVRSQVPPLIGNGCKHRQIRFTEKFFLGDTVVHKVAATSTDPIHAGPPPQLRHRLAAGLADGSSASDVPLSAASATAPPDPPPQAVAVR
uniref:Uncharacterized protein n=1 Tax=Oryza nivara TaxID=4536 RepID=A0A0E0J6A6_ORYNI